MTSHLSLAICIYEGSAKPHNIPVCLGIKLGLCKFTIVADLPRDSASLTLQRSAPLNPVAVVRKYIGTALLHTLLRPVETSLCTAFYDYDLTTMILSPSLK